MKQSPVRIFLVILFVFIGCFGVAFAAAGMFTALPAPAVGGTCGPSTASETAAEALAEPGSIGAGPQPPTSNVTAHHQWETFVQQCQSLADRRGLASLAIFVISVVVAGVGLFLVLRKPRVEEDDDLVDGAADWPGGPVTDDAPALVGVGAVAAPGGTWAEAPQAYAPAPSYAPAPPYPYSGPGAYPAAPPYPYAAPGAYPPPGAYPQPSPYPAPGTYPQGGWPAQQPGVPPNPPPYPPYPEQAAGYPPQAAWPTAPEAPAEAAATPADPIHGEAPSGAPPAPAAPTAPPAYGAADPATGDPVAPRPDGPVAGQDAGPAASD